MPLTPADVHNVAFKKPSIGKRGYDEDEVDAFLDVVEAELSRLIEENNDPDRPAGLGRRRWQHRTVMAEGRLQVRGHPARGHPARGRLGADRRPSRPGRAAACPGTGDRRPADR